MKNYFNFDKKPKMNQNIIKISLLKIKLKSIYNQLMIYLIYVQAHFIMAAP